ncbi:D-alanyl-D-alanine carboxypeptidase [Streptomyces longispororuber]|uniref:D-alanyl-D-alanine carboxypeptidase n=1 Tax=Streptomyces longispororuber TaxID=68230 RepID=A0A919DY52_9ACTN|nr:serine hydrolase domain-containing protein [Streptomyces longispororuber]GHE89834.1 D-alanyl-D-alanine carboxypeptidase [Streptomyces longispororuber]
MPLPGRLTPARTGLVGAALAAAVTAGTLTAAPAAPAAPAASAVRAVLAATAVTAATDRAHHPATDHGHHRTQAVLEAAVRAGAPGATAHAWDGRGPWGGAAGVGDLVGRTPRGEHDRFRAASITKTFVATVLLQLEAEGRLDLDDKVGRWLPGVVEGSGHDGDRISVRRLLNHTSGIHDFSEDPHFERRVATPEFFAHRHRTWTPRSLVAIAMRHEPDFAPGTGWGYSNTNYVVAGMIIEKVTGRPYGEEIRRRVIDPLHLGATSVPGTDPTLPRPSSRAYSKLSDSSAGPTYDVTEFNPSLAGASGEVISSAADLNRFYTALLRGALLPDEQLAAMKKTVPATGEEAAGNRYGLGLMRLELPCGTVLWGHGGRIHGSLSMAVTTPDGGHALTYNFNGDWIRGKNKILDAEFCPTT